MSPTPRPELAGLPQALQLLSVFIYRHLEGYRLSQGQSFDGELPEGAAEILENAHERWCHTMLALVDSARIHATSLRSDRWEREEVLSMTTELDIARRTVDAQVSALASPHKLVQAAQVPAYLLTVLFGYVPGAGDDVEVLLAAGDRLTLPTANALRKLGRARVAKSPGYLRRLQALHQRGSCTGVPAAAIEETMVALQLLQRYLHRSTVALGSAFSFWRLCDDAQSAAEVTALISNIAKGSPTTDRAPAAARVASGGAGGAAARDEAGVGVRVDTSRAGETALNHRLAGCLGPALEGCEATAGWASAAKVGKSILTSFSTASHTRTQPAGLAAYLEQGLVGCIAQRLRTGACSAGDVFAPARKGKSGGGSRSPPTVLLQYHPGTFTLVPEVREAAGAAASSAHTSAVSSAGAGAGVGAGARPRARTSPGGRGSDADVRARGSSAGRSARRAAPASSASSAAGAGAGSAVSEADDSGVDGTEAGDPLAANVAPLTHARLPLTHSLLMSLLSGYLYAKSWNSRCHEDDLLTAYTGGSLLPDCAVSVGCTLAELLASAAAGDEDADEGASGAGAGSSSSSSSSASSSSAASSARAAAGAFKPADPAAIVSGNRADLLAALAASLRVHGVNEDDEFTPLLTAHEVAEDEEPAVVEPTAHGIADFKPTFFERAAPPKPRTVDDPVTRKAVFAIVEATLYRMKELMVKDAAHASVLRQAETLPSPAVGGDRDAPAQSTPATTSGSLGAAIGGVAAAAVSVVKSLYSLFAGSGSASDAPADADVGRESPLSAAMREEFEAAAAAAAAAEADARLQRDAAGAPSDWEEADTDDVEWADKASKTMTAQSPAAPATPAHPRLALHTNGSGISFPALSPMSAAGTPASNPGTVAPPTGRPTHRGWRYRTFEEEETAKNAEAARVARDMAEGLERGGSPPVCSLSALPDAGMSRGEPKVVS